MPTTTTISALMLRGISAGCALTGLGERTVWQLVNVNAIPHRRVGRAVLFVRCEVEAWIAAGCPTEPDSGPNFHREINS